MKNCAVLIIQVKKISIFKLLEDRINSYSLNSLLGVGTVLNWDVLFFLERMPFYNLPVSHSTTKSHSPCCCFALLIFPFILYEYEFV